MNRRTGLGRRTPIGDSAGDPLDGLVNLFDIGIVLAVAFLISGLGLALNQATHRLEPRSASAQREATVSVPARSRSATGRGQAVGTVYRLANGQLVLVQPGRGR
jgi:hypothetical protein